MSTSKPAYIIAGAIAVLFAAALLSYGFNEYSMWYDEINMATMARDFNLLSPDTYTDQGHHPPLYGHPPLYFMLGHGWIALVGMSDLSLRAFSWLVMLIGVAAIYRLGVDVTGKLVGGVIAVLLFGSMGYVRYHIHQTHNYALFLTVSMLLLLVVIRWWKHPNQAGYSIGVIVATSGALYTHYYGLFFVLALSFYALFHLPRHFKAATRWFVLQIVAGVSYLPWIPVILTIGQQRVFSSEMVEGIPTGNPTNWEALVQAFGGLLSDLVWLYGLMILISVGGLMLFRQSASGKSHTRQNSLILASFVFFGLLLALIANLQYQTFHARRVIVVLPALAILLSIGLARLPRGVAWPITLSTVVIAFASGWSDDLPGNWYYRQAIEAVHEQVEPGDFVLIQFSDDPFVARSLAYYASQLLSPDTITITLGEHALGNEESRADFVDRVAINYIWPRDRFWVIHSTVPELGYTDTDWVALASGRNFVATEHYSAGWLQAILFEAPPVARGAAVSSAALDPIPLPQHFGDMIILLDYGISSNQAVVGDTVSLILDWQAACLIQHEFAVYVHMIDNNGVIVAQADDTPRHAGRLLPTVFWPINAPIYDRHDLLIPPGTQQGTYVLRIGLYERATSQRLIVTPGAGQLSDGLDLATIVVE